MGNNKYLWLAVDADEYELPIAVTDSAKEMAKIFGTTTNNIQNLERGGYSGKLCGRKYVKVRRED